jgi:hypothetical protein
MIRKLTPTRMTLLTQTRMTPLTKTKMTFHQPVVRRIKIHPLGHRTQRFPYLEIKGGDTGGQDAKMDQDGEQKKPKQWYYNIW